MVESKGTKVLETPETFVADPVLVNDNCQSLIVKSTFAITPAWTDGADSKRTIVAIRALSRDMVFI